MEKSINILGFIAAAVATFLLFLCVCIYGVHSGILFTVMILLAFLAGGLCSFLRLVDVVSSTGMMTLGFLKDNRKLFVLLILGAGLISGGLTLIAFIWWTIIAASHDEVFLYGEFLIPYVCVILSGIAGLANVLLGFLQFRNPSVPAS
ncbi:uncharacterized protein LOC134814455 [Bolinopsis microptera]|uniref:uncharacterized protein LOC134814455 n=1 Tax=Bolinopsis microptera TaxID=2820187 RepID=UPI00307AA73A